MRNNKLLRKEKISGLTWVFHGRFDSEGLRRILADPEKALREGELLKRGSVAKITSPDIERPLVIKKYSPGKKKKLVSWKYLFRPSTAFRVWRLARRIMGKGIMTAPPVAAGVERRLWYPVRSYYITEALEGYARLDEILTRRLSKKDKRILVDGMANFLRKLHENGFGCRDLKSKNIFVKMESSGPPGISLIDLDMVRSSGRLTVRRKSQNIARLNVTVRLDRGITTPDRLRFLRGYLGKDFENEKILRMWWKKIIKATRRKLKKSLLGAKYLS